VVEACQLGKPLFETGVRTSTARWASWSGKSSDRSYVLTLMSCQKCQDDVYNVQATTKCCLQELEYDTAAVAVMLPAGLRTGRGWAGKLVVTLFWWFLWPMPPSNNLEPSCSPVRHL
jgi:hypothetical protein